MFVTPTDHIAAAQDAASAEGVVPAEAAAPSEEAVSGEAAVPAEGARPLPGLPIVSSGAPTVSAIRYRLDNGLEVVLDPTGEDTVAVCVIYHAGASSQPAGHTGLAHLAEHVMFEGSSHARRHFLDELDVLGVLSVNGTTERDRTRYYEVVTREHLDRVLFLEADRMAFVLSHLTEAPVRAQREVVLRELEERVDLGGLGLVPGLIASVLYTAADHPYADLFEHRDDIESIQLADVQYFLATHYAPENATLVVSGGFDVETARATILRRFGPIRRVGEAPVPIAPPAIVRLPAERRLVVEAPMGRDELRVIWPTPPEGAEEQAALEMLAVYLEAELDEALLYTHVASAVWARHNAYELASEFEVQITTRRRDGTLASLEAVDRVLTALQTDRLDDEQLAALVVRVYERQVARMESSVERALQLGRRPRLGGGRSWSLADDLARWRAVTPDALREVARTWLPRHQRLVLSLAATRGAPFEGRVVVDLTLGPDGQELAP